LINGGLYGKGSITAAVVRLPALQEEKEPIITALKE
jgi:hypothetical protein